jgi:hypothetical protein
MTRGDDGATPVEVPAGASSVDFQLILMGSRFSTYRASLFKGDREISSWNKVKAVNGKSGNYVLVSAPVKSISNGSYYILLNGVTANGDLQEINRYYFRISRK